MEKIYFIKMSGAGNDFIVFDRKKNPGLSLNPELIQKFCDRRNGIGADGVIAISDSNEQNFVMDYYNADGSFGALCGNGARCAVKYAEFSGRLNNGTAKFLSNSILYSGKVLGRDDVQVYLNPPSKYKNGFKIKAANQLITACYVDTGAPHVIVKIEDVLKDTKNLASSYDNLDEIPVYEIGREIRYLKDFAPEGTNVNFIKIKDGKIHIRTYERGVESETLACGTGAVAAAYTGFVNEKLIPPVYLKTRGGDELIVDFKKEGNKIREVSLTGPAKIIFSGEISLNTIH
ncbi:MAG TPA: diaminopimelate epimerase [Ignavibacteriaceae bacterium]|nr:diaminopimelate epimerase [Ignavibacteriaceae bacterium]